MILGQSGSKTFNYFSSDAGKGFISSDEEEVTGVISVKNEAKKKPKMTRPSFRDRITDTLTDTLKGRGKKRTDQRSDIPDFLFQNKPCFSSEESLDKCSMRAEYIHHEYQEPTKKKESCLELK